MELLAGLADIVLNLDEPLRTLVDNYGIWAYAILFAIIFLETGVVITPFLPGASLLFVGGIVPGSGLAYGTRPTGSPRSLRVDQMSKPLPLLRRRSSS